MKKKHWLIAAIIFVVMAVLALTPIPYVLEMPGSAEQASDFITVNNDVAEKDGSFRVMTVFSQQATPLLALQALLPHVDLLPREQVYGEQPSEDYYKIQEYNMEQARNAATVVAYRAAGANVTQTFDGIYVMSVVPESAFASQLKVGDIITAVNGQTFASTTELMAAVRSYHIGDTLTVDYRRGDETHTATGTLMQNPDTGAPMIGIQLVSHSIVDATPSVTFDAHGVSGPSAGLMLTLEIYNQLTDGNLKNGQIIAGTGTMDDQGNVGRIGGVDKKVVAAVRAGATVFLAPDDTITPEMKAANPDIKSNYEEAVETAKSINANIQVYPVKTFNDALEILRNL